MPSNSRRHDPTARVPADSPHKTMKKLPVYTAFREKLFMKVVFKLYMSLDCLIVTLI